MERLTDRCWRNLDAWECCGQNFHCSRKLNDDGGCINGCIVPKLYKHLAEYEDLEEQGLLLKLPCKVGDTVWDNDYGKPCPYTVTGFSFGTGECYIDEPVSLKEVVYYYSNYSGSITGSFAVSELGKSVFLTQAEAEKKLKESEA